MTAGRAAGLALAIEHCRRLRDDAVAIQTRVRVELGSAEQTLRTLESYREEQSDRARAQAGTTLSVIRLVHQTRFAGTLDDAIRQQVLRVDELRARMDGCRAAVLHQQQRLKAIETIAQRRIDAAERRAARREQHATDERAALRIHPSIDRRP